MAEGKWVNERHVWMGAGLGILGLLVITTPGWQEVLGLNLSLDLSGIAPGLIILGVMGALVAFVLLGGEKKGD